MVIYFCIYTQILHKYFSRFLFLKNVMISIKIKILFEESM